MKLSQLIASLGLLVLPLSGHCEGYLSKTEFLNAVRQGDIVFSRNFYMPDDQRQFLVNSIEKIMIDDYKTTPRITQDCYNSFTNSEQIPAMLTAVAEYFNSTRSDEPPNFRAEPREGSLDPVTRSMAAYECSKEVFGKRVEFPVIQSLRQFISEVAELLAEKVAEEREQQILAYQNEQNQLQVEQRRNLEAKQREKLQQKLDAEEAQRRIEQEQKDKAARNKKRVAG